MTRQRDLDQILGAFFVEGTNEIADRVIDAALDTIDTTSQRRRMPALRRFTKMSLPMRLAAAAVIGVLAVSGVLFLWRPFSASVGTTATPSPASSQAPGATSRTAWTTTGSLAGDYERLSATLLNDGRVLALGGGDPFSQVYSPVAGTWSPTRMAYPRGYPAAARTGDGRVVVAGGNYLNGYEVGELFDPASGTWRTTSSLIKPRQQPSSIVLPDGRVLVVGGDGGGDLPLLPTAEIFDASTGAWTATAPMQVGRANAGINLLHDGRVLVSGGFAGGPGMTLGHTCEIYDPATDTWTATGSMHDKRVFATSITLTDGRVLVVGGDFIQGDIYDPATGTWTATGPVSPLHGTALVSVLLPDGSVYVTGGGGIGARLDPATGNWTAVASGPSADVVRSATPLSNGKVLVVEGLAAGSPTSNAPAELLDPAALP